MNSYFKMNETLYEVTEKYPETIDILVNIGMENMKDKSLRETMGKTITLEQAFKMKKVNEKTLEERLVEVITENQNKVDTTLVQRGSKEEAKITIQGVLPCPIRIPLLEGFEKWLAEQEEEVKEGVDYELQAASMGVDWIKERVKEAHTSEVLADLFISAGFDLFFDKQLMGKFKTQGVFQDLSGYEEYNHDFDNDRIQLRDPKRQYSMLGVVPAIFLVNKEELNGRSMPKSWEDILTKDFENSVSLPIGDFDLFNAILLNIHKTYGEEGIKKLGKSLLQSMHPSEMVKSHTKKINKPVVTIMPYFFTKMTKEGGPMIVVWPEDGAIISPIFMLSKFETRKELSPFIEFFTSKQVGEILAHQGLFPSVHPQVDNRIHPEKQYMWLGWDYINQQDMGVLIRQLENLFQQSVEEEVK